ncbi:MAG: hypothetical protein V4722_05525 [Bacteroidota bacterium]
MKKTTLFLFFACQLLIAVSCLGQKADFRVSISNNVLKHGDTLDLEASYAVGDKKLPPATLDVIIQNERGNTWNIRWPLIDGKAEGSIVMSKFIPEGKYDVWLAVQPRVFRIYGQVVYCSRKKVKTLDAYVVKNYARYEPQQIKLEPDRSFLIKDWMLTDEMNLAFTTGDPEEVLHIHPEFWLDSAYRPAAQSYVTVMVTDKDTVIKAKTVAPALRPLAWSGTGVYNNLSPAEVYNQFFSKGMFRDTSEITIDVIGDTAVRAGTNTLQYITDKLLLYNIAVEKKMNKLWLDGRELVVFYNEGLLQNSLASIRLKDVAIIKLLRHHVTTGEEKGANALAIYPRRYPFTEAGIAQNMFRVKGYNEDVVFLK